MPDYYAIRSQGPDIDNLKLIVATAVLLASNHDCDITLLVPDRQRLSSTILVDALGERFVDRIQGGGSVKLLGRAVRAQSLETLNPFQEQGVLAVLWGNGTMLARADECLNSKVVMALSLVPGELDHWINRHDASVLMESMASTAWKLA